jgi:hypothetical protein
MDTPNDRVNDSTVQRLIIIPTFAATISQTTRAGDMRNPRVGMYPARTQVLFLSRSCAITSRAHTRTQFPFAEPFDWRRVNSSNTIQCRHLHDVLTAVYAYEVRLSNKHSNVQIRWHSNSTFGFPARHPTAQGYKRRQNVPPLKIMHK